MRMSLLILSLIIEVIINSAFAITIYKDEKNEVDIGGRISIRAGYEEDDDISKLEDNVSRLNLRIYREISPDWTASAILESAFDVLDSSELEFKNRLGYVSFKNNNIGDIRIGKQWSSYYDITGWTDLFWIFGGEASGTYDGRIRNPEGHGNSGTGRADDAISYRRSIDSLNISTQYQFGNEVEGHEREYGLQGSLSYHFNFGLTLGAAYNHTEYSGENADKTWTVGGKYLSDLKNGNAIYVAANYGQFKNHTLIHGHLDTASENARGGEFLAAYLINHTKEKTYGDYQIYTGFNGIEDKNTSAEYSYGIVGVGWIWGNVIFATEYRFNTIDRDVFDQDNGADQIALLVRYEV